MAEEKAAAPEAPAASSSGSNKSSAILTVVLILNMGLMAGIGFMMYKAKKAEAEKPSIQHVIEGEVQTQEAEAHAEQEKRPPVVLPLETFIVNLAGSKGRRVAKVNIEIELDNDKVQEEIEKRKAQIRDIMIITLSSKTYDEVASREGKEKLREEIKDTVNAFLTKGKITSVYFTEFIYN